MGIKALFQRNPLVLGSPNLSYEELG